MTITRYSVAPKDGPERDAEYDTFEEAEAIADRDGLQLIARYYEFHDSELVADFTRYHWLVTTRLEDQEDDDTYRPHGLDECVDAPVKAVDNLLDRLTRVLENLDDCGDGPNRMCAALCDSCRAYRSLGEAVRELEGMDVDEVERNGYSCTKDADVDDRVVYRITRILFSNCDEENHR